MTNTPPSHTNELPSRGKWLIASEAASQSADPDMQARYQAVIALLDQLSSATGAEAAEQRETGHYLMQSLDEDRPAYRKFFH